MIKEGFIITIHGRKFEKEILFSETKPTEKELDEMVKENKGIRAFVTTGEIYMNASE